MLRLSARLLSLVLVVLVLAVGCAPEVRQSDDGHHAWARQVVPSLLGRQPAGGAEVRLIADLASLVGRARTADALMQSAGFTTHWSDVILDLVRAQREGNKDLRACIGAPLRQGSATEELANWVKANDPTNTNPPGGAFNLADLLVSSVLADDLSPFLRAYTFALASRPLQGNEHTEQNMRDDLYNSFEGVLLGRNSTCLVCHNASWSHTGEPSGWNRTFAPLGFFERSLLGAHSGAPDPKRVSAMFRVGGVLGGPAPWGMVGCGNFQVPSTDDPELSPDQEAFLAGDQGRRASIHIVEKLLRLGILGMRNGLNRSVAQEDVNACVSCGSCPPGSTEPELTQEQKQREEKARSAFERNRCFTCHAAGSGGLTMRNDPTWKNQLVRVGSRRGQGKSRVEPVHPERSFLVDALLPSSPVGQMPPGGPALKAAELADVQAWIDGLPVLAGCGTCAANHPGLSCPAPEADVAGHDALAYLVALNLTDNIWGQVMGRPLTLAHNYSRNNEQNQLLWHLTEFQFVANGWSLKKLLNVIVTSDYFNRRPPEDGDGIPKPAGGSSPYDLPMLFNPWVAQDPRVPPATDPGYVAANHPDKHGNAMAESIERKTPVTLFRSVALALGWPEPKRVPVTTGFPSRELAASIGQFLQDSVPGFRGHNFTALVEWEANVATCRKPDSVVEDWVDRLETAIRNHNQRKPDDVVTVIEAAQLVKDWLLADGRMSVNERKLVAELFGRRETESVVLVPSMNDRLRDFCGVLLQTAQFTLSGMTWDGAGPRPKFRVCNGVPCTYKELCERLGAQGGLRTMIRCEEETAQLIGPSPVAAKSRDQPELTAKLSPDVIDRLTVDASKLRLPLGPDQLRDARVLRAKGLAVLTSDGLKPLQPGTTIPPNALVLSEKGAELLLDIGNASVPVQLTQQLPKGALDLLERQLAKLPREVRDRVVIAAAQGKPLATMATPNYSKSRVPPGVIDSTLLSAFPYGSAGDRPERRTTPFDDRALQERFKAVREMRK
jgi:hypothetical protein